MKINKLKRFQIISVLFIWGMGIILHFTYNLLNYNKIVALFSSVNESTWEHLKLVFFPSIIMIIIGNIYFGKKYSNYICAKTIGTIISMSGIVIFFYTYSGIIGNNYPIIDIASFLISVVIGEYSAYLIIKNKIECNKKISILVLLFFTLCFFLFTFYPPKIGIFKDPITGEYGIKKQKSYLT